MDTVPDTAALDKHKGFYIIKGLLVLTNKIVVSKLQYASEPLGGGGGGENH